MKKLTAGIFTVLMGLVSVNAADAAVASKGYVDKEVATAKTNASELVGNLANGQVAANTKLIGNFGTEITNNQEIKTAGVKSAGNLSQAVAALDAAVAAASGDLEGLGALASEDTVSTGLIDNSAVITDKIADSAVTSAKIADSAVTSAKIADGSVATLDLADDAVTTDKIADNSVSSQQLTADVRTTISNLQKAVSETAADGILSKAKAYSDEKDVEQTTAITTAYQNADTATLNSAKAYTDDQIEALDLKAISRVPAACGNADNYCVLTTNGTNFVWEVIARDTEETVGTGEGYTQTGVTVPESEKPQGQ